MPSATARTAVPGGTCRVEPSGRVTVTWSMVVWGGGAGTGAVEMVGTGGLEPPTSCVSSRRSNQTELRA